MGPAPDPPQLSPGRRTARDRLTPAVAGWRRRDITSPRMLVTAIGLLGAVVPIALFYVAVGPTGRDRLGALAFAAGAVFLGLYSLWESKSPALASRRSESRHLEP